MTEDEVRVALHSISTGHVGWGDGEWNDLLLHDSAQRARIHELETDLAIERQRVMVGIAQMEMATKRIEEMSAKLAALQHIGTGAGAVVRRGYE